MGLFEEPSCYLIKWCHVSVLIVKTCIFFLCVRARVCVYVCVCECVEKVVPTPAWGRSSTERAYPCTPSPAISSPLFYLMMLSWPTGLH